jgi:hypothetical protein
LPVALPAGPLAGRIISVARDTVSITIQFTITVPTLERRGRRVEWVPRKETHKVEIWLPKEVQVRLMKPRTDDEGRPVHETPPKDPKNPDHRLPGVEGTPQDLRPGQEITATLERNREGHLFAKTIIVLSGSVKPKTGD